MNSDIIKNLVSKALEQPDIIKVITRAMFNMACFAEEDSAQQLYDVADWEDLSQVSNEIMFGKQVPDSEGNLPSDEDYDDTREGDFIMMHYEARLLLMKKVADFVLNKMKEWISSPI